MISCIKYLICFRSLRHFYDWDDGGAWISGTTCQLNKPSWQYSCQISFLIFLISFTKCFLFFLQITNPPKFFLSYPRWSPCLWRPSKIYQVKVTKDKFKNLKEVQEIHLFQLYECILKKKIMFFQMDYLRRKEHKYVSCCVYSMEGLNSILKPSWWIVSMVQCIS